MRLWLPVLAFAMLAGCGYPGEPLPPALNRPLRVADLTVMERGGKILASFTIPKETSEGLPIKTQPEIDMRVGPIANTFIQAEWEQGADRVPADQIKVENGRVEAEIPAAKYVGRTQVVGVRLLGPKGRNLGWSVDVLNVLAELPRPEGLVVTDASGGVGLEWRVAQPAPDFRVFRRLKGTKEWTRAGSSDKPSYLDTGIEYGKSYEYYVASGETTGTKYAESDGSDVVSIVPKDKFAPAAPAGLAAVPGTKSIELVWDSSKDADFAFYRVYRDNAKVADSVTTPSYSDRDVVGGAKHSYQVTAVDSAGNESTRSAAVEATLP